MKRVTSFPHWQGFEFSPDGCLLEQVIDLSSEMGFAYERSCDFYKDFHTHDRLMLVCPRGSSAMEVRTKNPHKSYFVDSSSVLVVPKNLIHDDEGVSCIYDTMAFYPADKFIEKTAAKLGLKNSHLQKLSDKCLKISRNGRLNRLTQDFFYEKVVANADDQTLDYLGSKIISEVLTAIFGNTSLTKPELKAINVASVAVRAIQFIESNLFAKLELDAIAKHSGASISTLLRRFKSEIKQTPYAYIKSRRMEEALGLLKTANYSVGEVGQLVGYENFGSFTDAFKAKYGRCPSEIKSE